MLLPENQLRASTTSEVHMHSLIWICTGHTVATEAFKMVSINCRLESYSMDAQTNIYLHVTLTLEITEQHPYVSHNLRKVC